MRKKYIVDTNVIISNPFFAREFENCDIIVPIHVFEELDKLKGREGNVGFRARQFFRYFKQLEKEKNLLEGNMGLFLQNGHVIMIIWAEMTSHDTYS